MNLLRYWKSQGMLRAIGSLDVFKKALPIMHLGPLTRLNLPFIPSWEYVIEQFLRDSKSTQVLLTIYYDGLLAEKDLIHKDNDWFTEKMPLCIPSQISKDWTESVFWKKSINLVNSEPFLLFKVDMKRQKVIEYLSGNLCSR